MPAARYTVAWSGSALASAGNPRTVVQLVTASTAQIRIIELSVSLLDTMTTDTAVEIVMQRQTTAGTASAGTVTAINPGAPATAQTTAQVTFTAEPTAGAALQRWKASLNTSPSTVFEQWPLGREIEMDVSTRLGVTVTSGGTLTGSPVSSGYIIFEGMGG